MPKKGQKNFNVNINENLAEKFADQIEKRGYTKYRAIEGALVAFMKLPIEEQVKLISTSYEAELIEEKKKAKGG